MKPVMREQLAQLPFEEKIRKVGELIRLAKTVKKGDTLPERLDTSAAELDAGEGVPIKRVREDVRGRARSPKKSKK
jgi:hypothetical protein